MTNTLVSDRSEALESDTPERGLEHVIAAVIVVIIGLRIQLPHLLTVGDVLAVLLAPVWIRELRRYTAARTLIGLGCLALLSGGVLTMLSIPEHGVNLRVAFTNNFLLVGLLASVGFLLWARDRLGTNTVIILFSLGTIAGVNRSAGLFSESPWKFGYATGVTLLALGLSHLAKRRLLELVLVIAFLVVSAATDSRSIFAILLLVATLLAWQARPQVRSHAGSAVRGLLGLGIGAALIFNVGQALIVNGLLGAKTQLRSVTQINETGSLLLGGRPEISATIALMRDSVFGYGSGTLPSWHDIMVAKEGLAAINYNPNNGYVDNYMFGGSYELHSIAGDVWARFGIIGLGFVVLVATLIAIWLGRAVTSSQARGVVLFATILSLWNIAFAPLYAAIPVLGLTLAVIARRRELPERDHA